MVLGQVRVGPPGEQTTELRRGAEPTRPGRRRRPARKLAGAGACRRTRRCARHRESTKPRLRCSPGAAGALLAADPPAGRPGTAGRTTILTRHHHKPGLFDPGHCRACARQAGLLDHHWRVQRMQQCLEAYLGASPDRSAFVGAVPYYVVAAEYKLTRYVLTTRDDAIYLIDRAR